MLTFDRIDLIDRVLFYDRSSKKNSIIIETCDKLDVLLVFLTQKLSRIIE